MGAKEDILLLEQKVDILYNIINELTIELGCHETQHHLVTDIFPCLNVMGLTENELAMLGK